MNNPLINYVKSVTGTYDPQEVMDLLMSMSREETISFLQWNDNNGIFSDEACRREDIEPMTETGAKLLAMRTLWEQWS